MKAFELLTINQGMYVRLAKEGHKKTYIVQYLSDEYEISCRNVYRVIEKFSADIGMPM